MTRGHRARIGDRVQEPKTGMWRTRTENGWEWDHHLAARSKFPTLPEDARVRFIDGDRSNPHPDNLIVEIPVTAELLAGVPYPVTVPLGPVAPVKVKREPKPARKRTPRIEVSFGGTLRDDLERRAADKGITPSQYIASVMRDHLTWEIHGGRPPTTDR